MTDIDSFEDAARSVEDFTVEIGEHGVAVADDFPFALTDVFTAPFVREHTDAASFAEFVDGSPLAGAKQSGDVDGYVAAHSEFDSWEEMATAAKTAWLERELGLL